MDMASLIGSILALVGVVWVAIITQSGARRTTRVEAEASPYGELSKRVVALEQQVEDLLGKIDELRQARDEDRAYIRRVLAAWSVHLPDVLPPQPYPNWYAPHPSQQPKEPT